MVITNAYELVETLANVATFWDCSIESQYCDGFVHFLSLHSEENDTILLTSCVSAKVGSLNSIALRKDKIASCEFLPRDKEIAIRMKDGIELHFVPSTTHELVNSYIGDKPQ